MCPHRHSLLIIFLFLLLCFLCSSFAHQNYQHRHRNHHSHQSSAQRIRRNPKSRQRNTQSECLIGYRERIEHHCRYPNMEKPCFRSPGAESNDQRPQADPVEAMARDCCESGRLCSVEDFETLCGRTMDCLAQCYGPSFLAKARSQFRYLDILIQAHPGSNQKAHQKRNGEGRRKKSSDG